MPDFSLGKVYKIVGAGKVYVGSTTQKLYVRFSEHRHDFKQWKEGLCRYTTSFQCFEDPECRIELLEECPCNSKIELHKCERKWIESLECVNKNIPGRSKEEYEQYMPQYRKEYYESNKERMLQQQKEYYESNKEKLRQWQREYRAKKKSLANAVEVQPQN